MNFKDIPADILAIRVKGTDFPCPPLVEQPVLSVSPYLNRPGEFEIRLKGAVVLVKPVADANTRRLNAELASGRALLAQLGNPAADGSIELQIAFFSGEYVEMGEIEIGVDETVENAMVKLDRRKEGFKGTSLYRRLEQICCFDHGDRSFFFLTAGPAIDDALQREAIPEEEAKEEREDSNEETALEPPDSDVETNTGLPDATQIPKPKPTRMNSFRVTGGGISFVATRTPRPDGGSIFTVTRLTLNKNEPDRALRLARGRLRFVDWTKAGQIQNLAMAQLSALTGDYESYLNRWDKFGSLEGELLLKQAREIGALQYHSMSPNRDGTVSVRINQASDSALDALVKKNVEALEVVDELPDYLRNPDLKFSEFASGIEQQAEAEDFFGRREQKRNAYYPVADFDAASKTLTIKTENLPSSGILILSLAGNIAQIKRRMFARRAIQQGRSANTQLGLLIESRGLIAQTRPPHKIKPLLTAFVRNKVFPENPPTPMQERAIEVALNTPDIALIQGPPGTGKTTVIAAIVERLNELADKRGASMRGLILLTGFQHDAVENLIDGLSLNGIPVPKFGKRSGDDPEDFSAFEKKLEDWCNRMAAELRANNPQITEVEKETEIKNLCLQYLKAPTRILGVNLAKKIAALDLTIIDEEMSRRAAILEKVLAREGQLNGESNPLLDAVRRLRSRREAFADDGPERATDALDDLSDLLEADERALLDKASLWSKEDGPPPFLEDLTALKKNLLIRLTAPPVFRVEKHNEELVALAEKAIAQIRVSGFSTKDRRSATLAEFLAELEANPYGMIDAVSDYSFAFAATCQQSVNRQMQRQKGITGGKPDHKLEYEYVIVDEAARVSPRDLMIPMAQGKRIILVGDHRQLPHIVDETVIKELSEQEEEDLIAKESEAERNSKNWSTISLFEHLFVNRMQELEKQDGIPRRVTLDRQFRMHPLLGDFVSRNFYERFDPSERFNSGKGEGAFAHHLRETENRPAAWLDVPSAIGRQQRCGSSWTRSAEATAIARQLQAWMNSEEGKDLSYGVISFYKAQAELIKGQLSKIANNGRKLRIGTVDAFQGMEFDVVFLSMVRTMPSGWQPRSDDKEKQARALFGHLCLYNRLNVSMSRQKRLLVVAGDPSLVKCQLAAEFIPGLVDFLKLCRTEGRVLACR